MHATPKKAAAEAATAPNHLNNARRMMAIEGKMRGLKPLVQW
jgi:hypothetical protein